MFKITTKQIAELANVSRSTVSRVINNYENVPIETKKKVQKIIDEYGYTPNYFARTLAGKNPNIIGIFLADINTTFSSNDWIGINSPYNMELISVIVNLLKSYNHVALVNIITDIKELKNLEHYFLKRIVAGGIFAGFPYNISELEELARKYNIVLIDQMISNDGNDNLKLVNSDNNSGGYIATKYLIDKGHTNILHIAGDNRLSSIQRERGYKTAMKEFNLEPNIIYGMYREDIAYKITKNYVPIHKPSAIFAGNDIMAIGVIKALKELMFRIPEDISVMGFDNLNLTKWFNLDITTMSVSIKDIGENSVKLLFEEKDNYSICRANLIERSSVAEKMK